MNILNLYSGLGGNRREWVGHNVTSVEISEEIAKVYKDLYPNDTLIIGDAHDYLLKHYADYDLIWSSPPCQSHSSFRHNICVKFRGTPPAYPDMCLYQEILFLKHHFKGRWVVENVKPYYTPLIAPTHTLGRHKLWTNFPITKAISGNNLVIRVAQIPKLQEYHGIDLSKYKVSNKRQLLRNCVHYSIGKTIIDSIGTQEEEEIIF